MTFRTLTLKDGGKIKEKLTGTEDSAYTYEIVESPLPVKNYKSKLWLEVDDEPNRSVIYWQSDFDAADGKTDEEAKKVITGILSDGVKGIKKVAIEAYDAKHPDAKPEGRRRRQRRQIACRKARRVRAARRLLVSAAVRLLLLGRT